MEVRPVSPGDLPALETGLRALAAELGDPFRVSTDALATAFFAPAPSCHGLLAEEAGQLRGVALYGTVMSTMTGGIGAYVTDLWVAAEARGQGVGRALLASVARHSGAHFLRLVVYADNPRAVAFYDRLGFAARPGEDFRILSGPALDALAP